jgi:hypothetical protein
LNPKIKIAWPVRGWVFSDRSLVEGPFPVGGPRQYARYFMVIRSARRSLPSRSPSIFGPRLNKPESFDDLKPLIDGLSSAKGLKRAPQRFACPATYELAAADCRVCGALEGKLVGGGAAAPARPG